MRLPPLPATDPAPAAGKRGSGMVAVLGWAAKDQATPQRDVLPCAPPPTAT